MTDPVTDHETEPANYGEALAELETILDGLETQPVDVDRLAADVQRAAILISLCRDRLAAVQEDVAIIVTDLDAADSSEPPGASE